MHSKQEIELHQERGVRAWLESYRKNAHIPTPLDRQNSIKSKTLKLFCLNIFGVINYKWKGFNPFLEDLHFRYSVTMFDDQKKQFCSRTYVSDSVQFTLQAGVENLISLPSEHDSQAFEPASKPLNTEGNKEQIDIPLSVSRDMERENNHLKSEHDQIDRSLGHKKSMMAKSSINDKSKSLSQSKERDKSKSTSKKIDEDNKLYQEGYQIDPIWVGFYGYEDTYFWSTFLIVEVTTYSIHNQQLEHRKSDNRLIHSEVIGFTRINIGDYLDRIEKGEQVVLVYRLYEGSARALIKEAHNPANLKVNGEMKLDCDFLVLPVEGSLYSLVGLYNLFGQDDRVIGLKEELVTNDPDEIVLQDLDMAYTLDITELQLMIHKSTEIDLIEECNIQYPRKYLHFKPAPNQITDFKVKSVQIVCHNGWKAVNQIGFGNQYMLRHIEPKVQGKMKDFNYLVMTNRQGTVDNCYDGAVILFQILYEADVKIDVLGRQTMQVYVGWCATTVRRIHMDKGECLISLEIMGGCGHSFDRQGYFSKVVNQSPGKLVARLKFQGEYRDPNMKNDSRSTSQGMKYAKNLKKIENPLKYRLIEQSKTMAKQLRENPDEERLKQQQKVKELERKQEETQKMIEGTFKFQVQEEHRSQNLVNEFLEVVDGTEKNLAVVQEKYQQEQYRLYQYRSRKEQLKEIYRTKKEHQVQAFDMWIYEGLGQLNMSVYYDIECMRDFIIASHFGYHDISPMGQDLILSRDHGGIVNETIEKLGEYLKGTLPQETAQKYERRQMKVQIQFLAYTPQLRFQTHSSKEEFTVPPLNTLPNHVPTRLKLTVHMFGKEKDSQEVYYKNGQTREDFTNVMSNYQPLILVTENDEPVLLEFVVPEVPLFRRYATVEIRNMDSECLLGKFWVPLFTLKRSHREHHHHALSGSKQMSASQSHDGSLNASPLRRSEKSGDVSAVMSSSVASSHQSGKDHKSFNDRLKHRVLPVPVCTACDVISESNEHQLGQFQVCVLVSSAGTEQVVEIEEIKGAKKKVMSNHSALVTREVNITNSSLILKEKYQQDPRFSSLMQVSAFKDLTRKTLLREIVSVEHFPKQTIIHQIGKIEIISYTLMNKKKEDCSYLIQIEDYNNRQFGQLLLIVDTAVWREAAIKYGYALPSVSEKDKDHHLYYNMFYSRYHHEINDLLFSEIILPPNSETTILFAYSALFYNDHPYQINQKNLIRVMVRSSLENYDLVGGLNISTIEKETDYQDVITIHVPCDTPINMTITNPIVFWVNEIRDIKKAVASLDLFSPQIQLNVKHFSIDQISFDTKDTLQEGEIIEAYIITFKDKDQLTLRAVFKMLFIGCYHKEYVVTQGRKLSVSIPLLFKESKLVKFRSSRPKEVIVPDRFYEGMIPVEDVQSKIEFDIICLAEKAQNTKVMCLQNQTECRTILINVRPIQPIISFLYDVNCKVGVKKELTFQYKNTIDHIIQLTFNSSHSQLRILQLTQEFKSFESRDVKCIFQAETLLHKVQIKVFVVGKNFYDCILFRVKYEKELVKIK